MALEGDVIKGEEKLREAAKLLREDYVLRLDQVSSRLEAYSSINFLNTDELVTYVRSLLECESNGALTLALSPRLEGESFSLVSFTFDKHAHVIHSPPVFTDRFIGPHRTGECSQSMVSWIDGPQLRFEGTDSPLLTAAQKIMESALSCAVVDSGGQT